MVVLCMPNGLLKSLIEAGILRRMARYQQAPCDPTRGLRDTKQGAQRERGVDVGLVPAPRSGEERDERAGTIQLVARCGAPPPLNETRYCGEGEVNPINELVGHYSPPSRDMSSTCHIFCQNERHYGKDGLLTLCLLSFSRRWRKGDVVEQSCDQGQSEQRTII